MFHQLLSPIFNLEKAAIPRQELSNVKSFPNSFDRCDRLRCGRRRRERTAQSLGAKAGAEAISSSVVMNQVHHNKGGCEEREWKVGVAADDDRHVLGGANRPDLISAS